MSFLRNSCRSLVFKGAPLTGLTHIVRPLPGTRLVSMCSGNQIPSIIALDFYLMLPTPLSVGETQAGMQAYSFVSSYFSFKQNIICPL